MYLSRNKVLVVHEEPIVRKDARVCCAAREDRGVGCVFVEFGRQGRVREEEGRSFVGENGHHDSVREGAEEGHNGRGAEVEAVARVDKMYPAPQHRKQWQYSS